MTPFVLKCRHGDMQMATTSKILQGYHLQSGEQDDVHGDNWISECVTVCRHEVTIATQIATFPPCQFSKRFSTQNRDQYKYSSSLRLKDTHIFQAQFYLTFLDLVSLP